MTNIFNRPAGNIFGGNQNQPTGNIFGNTQPQQQGNIFSNQNQPQQGQQGGNIFAQGNQPQQGTNIFNQGNQSQQNANIFNQGNQQQTGLFNNPNTGGNIFNQQNQQRPNTIGGGQGTNIFSNQQQQQPVTGNIFNQQQNTGNLFNQQQQNQQQNPIFNQPQQQIGFGNLLGGYGSGNQIEKVKFQIRECLRKLDPRNLEHIRLDELNMFKEERVGNLSPELKNSLLILMNNMKDLKNAVDNIKKENDQLDKRASQYCKNIQEKLTKYKECLLQNISQNNMVEEVKEDIQMIEKQVNGFIIPLFNAHKSGRHHSFDSPDQFSTTIAKKVFQKMIELNTKIDQIVACHRTDQEGYMTEQECNSVQVLQQLVTYYQNIAAKVHQFTVRYNDLKKRKIETVKRASSYEEIMRRINDKVNSKINKDFKCYDLIKEIEQILQKREKRQQQLARGYERIPTNRDRSLRMNSY